MNELLTAQSVGMGQVQARLPERDRGDVLASRHEAAEDKLGPDLDHVNLADL